ncbi:trypsin-like serine protease [Xanthomonas axonopodis pv. ricini]|uniref:trypsin-like serine protease n=1 Tax=Xanthomonas euvesicatoria TaxID=456327 RepID=UPI002456B5EF|nr:trypsin-like serine protease [Xanthomonas euvesicatoria]MDH4906454.1 S1 family peptidase [Xanthomonas euvesicatoria]
MCEYRPSKIRQRSCTALPTAAQPFDAAHASELNSIDNSDSGGPVVTYDRHLIGIISSGEHDGRSMVYYTPMQQVLHELYSYSLAPADLPTAAGDDNPISAGGENLGWELAPTDG